MILMSVVRNRRTDYCTLGRMSLGTRQWLTIERPWVPGEGPAGKPRASCIAPGMYRLERHSSEAHPNSWAIVSPALGVWHYPWEIPRMFKGGRSAILIHPANYAHELLGCIAPGKSMMTANGVLGISRSRDAMNEINQLLKNAFDVQLEIREEMHE